MRLKEYSPHKTRVNFLTLLLISLFFLFLPGCASKTKPTDVCWHPIAVSEKFSEKSIDATDYFDLAVEVAKDHHFPPPMKYDKNNGVLIFGHEKIKTMPGEKMVVYMWVPNKEVYFAQDICVNTHILDVKGSALNKSVSTQIISNFVDDLNRRYQAKIDNNRRIMNKYNVN